MIARMTYRVVQWATGRTGLKAMYGVVNHPDMELVGVYVHGEDKAGRDAGEVAGNEPLGVICTNRIGDIVALRPDVVLYMREGYDGEEVATLLRAGINIVTTRNEFFYAESMDPALRQQVEEACEAGGASLFATGSSPGFVTNYLPLALLAMSRKLDCLTIDEFADIPTSVGPDMIRYVMGFGTPAEGGEINPLLLEHTTVGFSLSLKALAANLNIEIDEWVTRGELAAATEPYTLEDGFVIEPGTMGAQRIISAGLRDGKTVLQFRSNWYCTTKLDKDWDLRADGWRVQIEGDTPVLVDISFPPSQYEDRAHQLTGLTAHPVVNSIPHVVAAKPGILTVFDLPALAAPRLN
jgi:4-hydroxy-tetrahydrodipicolinate reductase